MSRNYLEALVIFMVAVALGVFLVRPKYDESQAIKQKIEEKAAEIKNRGDYYASLEAVAADLDKYADNLKKIDTALPDNPGAPALMSFIQAAAMQSGLAVKNIGYSNGNKISASAAEAGQSVLQVYTVSAQFSGNYASLKNFLSVIGKSSRLIAVDSIGLDSGTVKNGNKQAGDGSPGNFQTSEGVDKILDYNIELSANYYQQ